MIYDGSASVRECGAWALGNLAYRGCWEYSSIQLIEALVRDEDADVRRTARWALAMFSDMGAQVGKNAGETFFMEG